MDDTLMAEGGLKTDGAKVDPVSGNEVPTGSTAQEVRDDIPAKLSDGEYVVPADVVKFFGVHFFEKLREKAKVGLADMEADGRVGGEPVQDEGEDDSLPFSAEELQAEDDGAEMEAQMQDAGFATGGVASASDVAAQQSGFNAANYPIGFSVFGQGNAPAPQQTSAATTSKVYVNKAGLTVVIPFDASGKPTIPIPEGYTLQTDTTKAPVKNGSTTSYADRQAEQATTAPKGVTGGTGADNATGSVGGSMGRLKTEDFSSQEALIKSGLKDVEQMGRSTTAGKIGGGLLGGPVGGVVGGIAGTGYQLAELRAKIQVGEHYGYDVSELKKAEEDIVDKLGIGSKAILNAVATGSSLATGYLKNNPSATRPAAAPATRPTTAPSSQSKQDYGSRGVSYTQTGSGTGGSFSSRTATGSTAPTSSPTPKSRPSNASSQSKQDYGGTRGGNHSGRAKGGLMKKSKK